MKIDKRTIFKYLRIFVSIFLIAYIISKVNYREFAQVFFSVKIGYFLFGLLLNFIVIVMNSYRWKILLASQMSNISMRRLVSLWFIGLFFNNFLPTSLGGDAVKAYYLYRHSNRSPVAVSSLIMLRLMGVVGIVILVSLAIIFGSYQIPLQIRHLIVLFLGLMCVLILLPLFLKLIIMNRTRIIAKFFRIFNRWLWFRKVMGSLAFYKKSRSVLSISLLLTVSSQLILILVNNVFCIALDCNVHPMNFFIFIPIINFLQMLPISLNGLGIREGAYIYFFGKIGMSASNALSLSLLILFNIVIFSIIGGIIYACKKD